MFGIIACILFNTVNLMEQNVSYMSWEGTGTIAIDLSKAFDSICHNLLLAKLQACGLKDDAIAFLQSYLTDHQ